MAILTSQTSLKCIVVTSNFRLIPWSMFTICLLPHKTNQAQMMLSYGSMVDQDVQVCSGLLKNLALICCYQGLHNFHHHWTNTPGINMPIYCSLKLHLELDFLSTKILTTSTMTQGQPQIMWKPFKNGMKNSLNISTTNFGFQANLTTECIFLTLQLHYLMPTMDNSTLREKSSLKAFLSGMGSW